MLASKASIDRAIEAATRILEDRFPAAAFAIAAGSIIRGEGTLFSDIDMLIVFDRLPNGYRQTFIAEGFPVEVFVHDPETLNWFLDKDIDNGVPVLVDMIATGRAIGRNVAAAEELQRQARALLARGPAFAPATRDALRYEISDHLDDLRGERTPAEIRAIAAKLYHPLADLALLGRGAWSGKGKWVPRRLQMLDPQLASDFDSAFSALANGDTLEAIAFIERELARHGGPWFAGDHRDAPATARRSGPLLPE